MNAIAMTDFITGQQVDLIREVSDEQILAAFNRGRRPDSEIDRENAVEISGGDPAHMDIEMD